MVMAMVSEKGQITLPSKFREQLGIKPHERVRVEAGERSIIIKKVPSIWDFDGFLAGKGLGMKEERRRMAEGVAAHVLGKE